jgi:lipid II:glycine glycyltransferase (peptidoglycan interpeptide bridge formation enzyme)
VPLADWSLFGAAFDASVARHGQVSAGSRGRATSRRVGGINLDTIYGWYGGMDRAYGDYIPNELLLWHIFRWGAEHGYRVYDFGGAGKPREEYGVRDFKAKFGGNLVCFGRNTYVGSRLLLRLSTVGYRLYRHFF